MDILALKEMERMIEHGVGAPYKRPAGGHRRLPADELPGQRTLMRSTRAR